LVRVIPHFIQPYDNRCESLARTNTFNTYRRLFKMAVQQGRTKRRDEAY